MKKIKGRVWKFGDNVDTDVIIPSQYCLSSDPSFLGQHAMEGLDAEFPKKVQAGDIIVAGVNFGCGSSREQAPLALKGAGIAAIVAKSFARIFFRNAINIGLPIFVAPEAVDGTEEGQTLEILPAEGIIRNLDTGKEFTVAPFPEFIQKIIEKGGLAPYIREEWGLGK